MAQNTNTRMVIDSPALTNPHYICNSNITTLRANQYGEADYALRHHVIYCHSRDCLVVASDTDVWVYGLGLWEAGWIKNKRVIVQRGTTEEYVDINLGARLIEDFSPLSNVPYPISTLVAMYVLTGCDYVSSFFRHTKQNFFECFLSNIKYILNNSLVSFVEDSNGHKVFESIVMEPCMFSILKHNTLYAGQTLEQFRDSFMSSPLDDECARLLGWVGLGDKECLSSMSDWCHFVRAVSFHKETAKKDFEANIMPSMAALDRHKSRVCFAHGLFGTI